MNNRSELLDLKEKENTKSVYLSVNANAKLREYISSLGYEIHDVASSNAVYAEVAAHPDIYMCKLGSEPAAPIYHGYIDKLGYRYPENIRYNAVLCGEYFIHNLKYTDDELLETAETYISHKYKTGHMRKIHVSQGYAKCNMVVVDDTHIITEDAGIAKAIELAMWRERNAIGRGKGEDRLNEQQMLEARRLHVLLITPKQTALAGFPYGFIGGASGRIDNEIIFNGDITKHTDYEKIKSFIDDAGLKIKYFDYPLNDIGSIIAVNTENAV